MELGAIAEVQIWGRVVSAAEVSALVDPINVGMVGEWRMDEQSASAPRTDASGFARDLSFYGGAEIPASGAGQVRHRAAAGRRRRLRLAGLPVLYTDQSFTASVWVRPIVSTGHQTFLTQYSTDTVPGFSMYHGATENEWKCKMGASATDGSGTTATLVTTPAPDTASYHQ